ncbi:MAG: GNAT family N-acetyltransferase [bacterium]|nr:GNAT family N-acetyltransferase [bacterium]
MPQTIRVRRAEERDKDFLFQLRNEDSVRAQSWHTERVDASTHDAWFKSSLRNPKRVLYVVEADGTSAGQVRFDVDDGGESAEVSVSVTERFRGKGIGSEALRSAGQSLFKDFPNIKKIFAHIKTDNFASVKTFQKAGYENRGIVDYEGHECIEMIASR